MRGVAEENEKLSDLIARSRETIKLWEDKKGVTLAADDVNDSICLWLSTLDGRLQSVDAKVSFESAWTSLPVWPVNLYLPQVQERDSRIAVLKAECLTHRLNVEEWKLKVHPRRCTNVLAITKAHNMYRPSRRCKMPSMQSRQQ